MEKLSERLRELSDHVATSEQEIARIANEDRENVKATIERAKKDAQARRERVKRAMETKKSEASAHFEKLRESYERQVEAIKGDVAAHKEARAEKRAQLRAQGAEEYATAAISFAMLAADEADAAVLDALAARAETEGVGRSG